VFYDGTNMDYVDPLDPGVAYDLHGVTALQPWMNACTVAPFLIKNGATYSTSVYPALSALLGSTFGGNGITTFGVPDESARMRLAYDQGATNRVTTAVSGVNGATMGSAGGNQALHSHTHANSLSDPGHTHPIADGQSIITAFGGSVYILGGSGPGGVSASSMNSAVTSISISNAAAGAGASQNIPPTVVSFLALIKT
jgi:microcystin-dependent protein